MTLIIAILKINQTGMFLGISDLIIPTELTEFWATNGIKLRYLPLELFSNLALIKVAKINGSMTIAIPSNPSLILASKSEKLIKKSNIFDLLTSLPLNPPSSLYKFSVIVIQ